LATGNDQALPFGGCTGKIQPGALGAIADADSPDVPRLEAEIDRQVYDIYGLTPDEIAIVEGKS